MFSFNLISDPVGNDVAWTEPANTARWSAYRLITPTPKKANPMDHFLCGAQCPDNDCKGKTNAREIFTFSKEYLIQEIDASGLQRFKKDGYLPGKECSREEFLTGIQKVTIGVPDSMGLSSCMYALTDEGFEVICGSYDSGFFSRELAASTVMVKNGERDKTHDGKYVAYDKSLCYMGEGSVHDRIPNCSRLVNAILDLEGFWTDVQREKLEPSYTALRNCRVQQHD